MTLNNKQEYKTLKYHPIIDDWYPVKYSIQLSDGCPYSCLYCLTKEKSIINFPNQDKWINQLKTELKEIPLSIIGLGGKIEEIFESIDIKTLILISNTIFELGHSILIISKSGKILNLLKRISEQYLARFFLLFQFLFLNQKQVKL